MYRFLPLIWIFSFTELCGQGFIDPEITRVLVDPQTNLVHIYFNGTDHPDVAYYKISQWMITGNNPVASGVPIESSRTAQSASNVYNLVLDIPEVVNEPVGFSVGAFNNADDILLESYPPDSTIHLSAVYDSCAASVFLQWNDYNAWRGNIEEFEIRGTNTDGSYNVLMQVPEEIKETTLNGFQANNYYHFYITARHNGFPADTFVTSNGVTFNTPHSFYPEYIHADYGTVAESNHPLVHFTIDPRSELDTFQLQRSENPTDQYRITRILNPDNNTIEYLDEEVDASVQPYYYRLVAINYCHEPVITSENTAGTLHLVSQLANFTINLEWTDYFNWNSGIERFDIERSLPGEDFQIIASTSALTYSDHSFESTVNQGELSEACYRITAHEASGDTHSTELSSSSSNIVCINLPMNVRFPFNAFVPGLDGFSGFGPVIDFLPAEATFSVYNRWGDRIFETSDIYNLRWNGQINGANYAPEGVYRFQFRYKNETGKESVIHGEVTVVRQ